MVEKPPPPFKWRNVAEMHMREPDPALVEAVRARLEQEGEKFPERRARYEAYKRMRGRIVGRAWSLVGDKFWEVPPVEPDG